MRLHNCNKLFTLLTNGRVVDMLLTLHQTGPTTSTALLVVYHLTKSFFILKTEIVMAEAMKV